MACPVSSWWHHRNRSGVRSYASNQARVPATVSPLTPSPGPKAGDSYQRQWRSRRVPVPTSRAPARREAYRLSSRVSPLRTSGGENVSCSVQLTVVDRGARAHPYPGYAAVSVRRPAHTPNKSARKEPSVRLGEGPPVSGGLLLEGLGEQASPGVVDRLRQLGPRQPLDTQVLAVHRLGLADDRRGGGCRTGGQRWRRTARSMSAAAWSGVWLEVMMRRLGCGSRAVVS